VRPCYAAGAISPPSAFVTVNISASLREAFYVSITHITNALNCALLCGEIVSLKSSCKIAEKLLTYRVFRDIIILDKNTIRKKQGILP
jgi:hypothetical protein